MEETQTIEQVFNWWPFLALLVPIIAGWVTSFISTRNTQRTMLAEHRQQKERMKLEAQLQEKKWTEQNKFVLDRLTGFENKLVDISMQLLDHSQDKGFRLDLINMFRGKATDIIDYNVDLDPKYRHLFMETAREFEDFALRFYDSNMRGKHAIEQYLKIDMNSRIAQIEGFMKQINSKPRFYKYSTGVKSPIDFLDYINSSNIYKKIDKLIDRLEINGFTKPNEIIEVFELFICDFFKEALRLVGIWEKLDTFDDEDLKDIFNDEDIEAEFVEE